MTERLSELAARREQLIAQGAELRGEFARNLEPWRQPAEWVDKAVASVAYLKAHKAVVGLTVAAMATARPRAFLRWLRRGWFAWRVVRVLARRNV